MKEGIVKFFNDSKGYGFIKDTETEEEYFVHVSGLVDEIRENDKVTFDLQEGKKGLNAVNVKLIQFKYLFNAKQKKALLTQGFFCY